MRILLTVLVISLISILFLSCSTSKESLFSYNQTQLLDLQESSFVTGCIGGFINLYQLGMYKPTSPDGHANYEKIKLGCQQQGILYRLELRQLHGGL